MTEPWCCPTCKQVWGEDETVDGLCPVCLLDHCLAAKQRNSGDGWERNWEPPPVEELQPLFADYEIQALIGRGGMGAVYRAIQKTLNRRVAIKILPPALGWNPVLKDRFVREALTLAKLNHPGFVTIYDSGRNQDLCYLVMEYVDGRNLREYVLENAVSPRQLLDLGIRLCRTMEVAHAAGIIHRDLKLENVLVGTLAEVKIADFGVAKLFGEQHADDGTAIFASCKAAGTRSFMAPEQLANPGRVDLRADVYSLGVMLYVLATGIFPAAAPVPPSQVKAEVNPRLDAVILRAMAAAPANRYQNMQELRRDLETILEAEKEQEAGGRPNGWRRGWKIAVAGLALFSVMGFAFWKGPWEQRSFGLAPGRAPAFAQPFVVALDNTTRLAMQPIPAGEFEMGSPPTEAPQRQSSEWPRQVRISRPFWMGKCEITRGQYQALTGVDPAILKKDDADGSPEDSAKLPVDTISWNDAVRFCEILTGWEQKAGRIPSGYLYRLPTEAEWEYAVREGGKSVVVTDKAAMDAVGWNYYNSGNQPHPVGQKQANGWGLHDLFGNASEWCLDCWSETPGLVTSPVDPVWRPGRDSSLKISRGGNFTALFFRGACRAREGVFSTSLKAGFRVVLAPAIKLPPSAYRPVALPVLESSPPETGKGYALWLPQEVILEMLPVAAGEFMMGSPPEERYRSSFEYLHRVQFAAPFWMGRVEVTQAQYSAIMGENPSFFRDGDRNAPVENVSWYGALAFCQRLTVLERNQGRLPKGLVYRLPTSAEWEYVCRAGGKTPPTMSDQAEVNQSAWYQHNSDKRTHPAGLKQANDWGFHDMFGNVAEWCLDACHSEAYLRTSPVDPLWTASEFPEHLYSSRVYRGNGFHGELFRCAANYGKGAEERKNDIGFRIVLGPSRDPANTLAQVDAETRQRFDSLPLDAQGFRSVPMLKDSEWWLGTFTCQNPEGLQARRAANSLKLCLRRFVDASQDLDFSCTWKVGGLPGLDPSQDHLWDVTFGLITMDGLPPVLSEMTLAKPHGDRLVIKSDAWYRSSAQIRYGPEAKIVLSLFGQEAGKEVLLKQWEAPISNQTREHFKHVRPTLSVTGNIMTLPMTAGWMICSEARIRQGEPPSTTP